MKRIYKYILFKISSTKKYIFSMLLVIYQIFLLFNLISNNVKYNIYDFIMENFSYLSLFFSINLFFLVIIYNIFDKKNFYNYLNVRFISRQECYRANILTAFIFSAGIVIFINIICILSGHFMSFKNKWSPYFFYINSNHINLYCKSEIVELITQKLTPLLFVLITNTLIILYLFLMAVIFIVCNIIIKKRAVCFLLIIVLNGISRVLDVGKLACFSFTNNIYLLTSPLNQVNNNTYIILKFIYWIVLIILMYFIGIILTKNKDCNYGE